MKQNPMQRDTIMFVGTLLTDFVCQIHSAAKILCCITLRLSISEILQSMVHECTGKLLLNQQLYHIIFVILMPFIYGAFDT